MWAAPPARGRSWRASRASSRTSCNERGWVRLLLSVQARWERRNVERADLVVVTSRYSADVAQREYGVPLERLAVVPEPIDLEVWDDQFWRAPPAPQCPGGPSVARMYPRKRLSRSPARCRDPARAGARDPGASSAAARNGDALVPPRRPGRATRSCCWATDARAAGRGVRERLRVLPPLRAGGLRHRVPGGDGRGLQWWPVASRRCPRWCSTRPPGCWWGRAIGRARGGRSNG
jgi:hypothetical protein